MLTIAPEKVCFILLKAREFDVKVPPQDPDPGSNPTDDESAEILSDRLDDPTYQELVGALRSLNDDELAELLAITWVGRGDFGKEEWEVALAEARSLPPKRTPRYLMGDPLLSDYLEEGLSTLGYSCEDYEIGRL